MELFLIRHSPNQKFSAFFPSHYLLGSGEGIFSEFVNQKSWQISLCLHKNSSSNGNLDFLHLLPFFFNEKKEKKVVLKFLISL